MAECEGLALVTLAKMEKNDQVNKGELARVVTVMNLCKHSAKQNGILCTKREKLEWKKGGRKLKEVTPSARREGGKLHRFKIHDPHMRGGKLDCFKIQDPHTNVVHVSRQDSVVLIK